MMLVPFSIASSQLPELTYVNPVDPLLQNIFRLLTLSPSCFVVGKEVEADVPPATTTEAVADTTGSVVMPSSAEAEALSPNS